MKRFSRILARLLDYSWLFALFLFFIQKNHFPSFSIFILFFALPLLFIPIEALLIKAFRTTLGKVIFGISYERHPSFKEAFLIALKKGLLILPLFLPPFNLAFAWIYYKELKKFPTSRFDEMNGYRIIKCNQSKPKKLFIIAFVTLFSFFAFLPDMAFNQVNKVSPYTQQFVIKCRGIGLFKPSDWIEVKSDEQSFIAMFPEKPKFETKDFDVPRSDQTLTYMEHHGGSDTTHHTIGSLELPQTWTKWGASNVLKGAIKFLADDAKIVTKDKSSHENYPALTYELEKGEHTIIGKLVLVENTLYKLEVDYDHKPTAEELELNTPFYLSFHPIKPAEADTTSQN